MKFCHINAGSWDEKLEGGTKSSVLRMCQMKNKETKSLLAPSSNYDCYCRESWPGRWDEIARR